jgi:transcriptional regulator with XRE-family HTH domain
MARKSPQLDEVVRKHIRELRQQRGLTQEELCERAGISVDAVSRIEGGSRIPTLDTLERLAQAFAVSPATFLDGVAATRTAKPGRSASVRRIHSLLDGQPEEVQRLAEQLVTTLVRAFSVGVRAQRK